MEHIIDIQLVKEQLRLLGHEVDDGVIIDFVKGLNKGSAGASQTETEKDAGDQDVRPQQLAAAAADISSTKQSKAARPPSASVSDRDTDAAPSKLQQAPDQQSPKRAPAAAAPEQDSPEVPVMQRAALDQRCRNFLSRCSDTPSPQQEQEQLVQHHQQQQQQLPLHPVLLHVPHVQDSGCVPGAAGSSSPQSVQSSGSSELLLDAGADTDSTDGSTHGFDAHTAAHWTQPPPSRQLQQQLAGFGAELGSRDSGEDSDSDGSSLVLEAEGSKFLLHQAATMQRVRARLAAKMAGYTAAASAEGSSGTHQLHASTGAGAARLGADSSGAASSASNSSAADSSSQLPRFGFRPGYKPVGLHMPPAPSAAAVEALAAARTLRQQISTEAGSATGAAGGSSSKAGTVPPLKLDLPLNMQSLTSAVNRLHEQQQQQAVRKGHVRVDPLLLPGAAGSVLHAIVSPGKAACASSVAAARASASIIGETPPCMASAAAGHKTRQSPRVDPLYLAPSSPRRSNPATPRSSPALSPAPMAAPLSTAAAAGPGSLRSPAGAAPAAALVAGRSSGSSAGAKQSLTFSSGSRGPAAARSSAQQHQQQQQQQRAEAGGGGRRASSAPPTPSAGAPAGALRGPAAGGVGGSSANSGCYSARRSAPVSHESLYCQRLSNACGSQRSTVAPGVRKTDRVARFQQMQQQWARDRFLSSGAGGAAKKSAGQ